jgi:hypothetical protein
VPGPESFALSLLRALSFIILLSSTSFASYFVHPFVAAPGDKPLNDPAPHFGNSGELEKGFIKAPMNRLYPLSFLFCQRKFNHSKSSGGKARFVHHDAVGFLSLVAIQLIWRLNILSRIVRQQYF